MRAASKDITAAPSTNNDVQTITRYRVTYRRSDGRNAQGSEVPYAFDGAVTATVPAGGSVTLNFELVRHAAKIESTSRSTHLEPELPHDPLAEVTFDGRDQAGHAGSAPAA